MAMLREHTVAEYMAVLASAAPAPGGGSAAALAGAQGAALGAMVTALTVGKKKYAGHEAHALAAGEALRGLADALVEDIDRDTAAYDAVSAAMKLPKDDPGRAAAIQAALVGATRSPLAVLAHAVEALGHVESLVGRSNTNTASDLGTGAAMLRAAAQGAWLNVLINLGGLKDEEMARALLGEGRGLYGAAISLADDVFARVEAMCMPEV